MLSISNKKEQNTYKFKIIKYLQLIINHSLPILIYYNLYYNNILMYENIYL